MELGHYPSTDQLPVQRELPDPFLHADGQRITSPREWKPLREYWQAIDGAAL